MSVDSDPGLKTGINVSGGAARQSLTNGSSARKFTANDQFENPVETDQTRSNAEHIVGHALGLKTTAMVAEHVAAGARDALDSVRATMDSLATGPKGSQGQYAPSFSDNDLTVSQANMAIDVQSRLGSQPPSISNRLSNTTTNIFGKSLQPVAPTTQKGSSVTANTAVPDIDHVTIQMDKKKGMTDCFFSTVTFNLPTQKIQNGQLRAVRVFRATVDDPLFTRSMGVLSARGMDTIRSDTNRSRSKNQDYYSSFETRLTASGITNAIGTLNAVDPVLGIRTSAASSSVINPNGLTAVTRPSGDDRISSDLKSYIDPSTLQSLDRSVANDPNSIANLVKNNPHLVLSASVLPVSSGKLTYLESTTKMGTAQLRDVSSNFQVGGGAVIGAPNSQRYRELAFISPGDPSVTSQIIGDMIQYTLTDNTIMYGKSYKYYIVTVDVNMNESPRSRIVQINVDGLRIPSPPKRVLTSIISGLVSLTTITDDQLIEKFEVYRKEVGISPTRSTQSVDVTVHAPASGYVTDVVNRDLMSNNFLQIGEVLNASTAGGVFFDRTVKAGQRYDYRLYAVDVFGNKSASPKEVSVFVPEPSVKNVELRKPSLLAEIDATTGKARVVIQADDPQIKGLFLVRRDLTLNQISFSPPGQPNFVRLGTGDRARGRLKFQDVRISDSSKDIAWTGYFERPYGQLVFIDMTSQVDHTYQYRLHGVDRFGNMTPFEFSKKIFVANIPLVNEPVNLSALVNLDQGGIATHVHLTWNDGNITVSAEDLLGNTEDLRESSVRNLYQVERRRDGDDTWEEFPMTPNMFFDDTVVPETGSSDVPGYRPEMLRLNETYLYRVSVFQTGTFISNCTPPISVSVATPVLAPVNMRVTHLDTKQRPFFVMLNWDTQGSTKNIDHWEIERSAVNNLAGAKLNVSNPTDFQKLTFEPFQTVYLEASRFREAEDDANPTVSRSSGSVGLFVGQHYFMDASVEFGNSYFYRIRSVSVVGENKSGWVYRGVKVTDASFEKKQDVVTTAAEKTTMASTLSPVSVPSILKDPSAGNVNSFSLIPNIVGNP